MENLSQALRRSIASSGLTRYAISQKTGVSESVLSRFLRGERGLTLETADSLMKFLGLEVRQKPRRES